MSVHYKFKSALEYDTVTFDGLHISVKDLKNAIVQQKRIGKNTDFDLQVTNAQTKEVYEDEHSLIPKNTSLLIARIPLAVQSKAKTWEGYGNDSTPMPRADEGGPAAKAVDLSSLDASEDDKIRAMMSQSTQDYDPSNYMKIRGANQVGIVPTNYRCYKCHQAGHWIKDCPTEQVEIKKSTGIPRSFMVPVEGPQVQGAMMTPYGSYAVPVLDHQTYTQKPVPHSVPAPVQKTELPEDLVCTICSDLLTDAVMIPCCGNSFCDECIRSSLLESEEHECPDCHEREISPGTLIPNRFLRNSVANFKNTTGYVKRQVYRPAVAQPVTIPVDKEVKSDETTDEVKTENDKTELTSESTEKTVISEADSTEPPKSLLPDGTNNKEERERKPVTEETVPVDLPPGVSPPNREKTPESQPITVNTQHRERSHRDRDGHSSRHSHKTDVKRSPRRPTRHRSPPYQDSHGNNEERPGTPTVDEPGMGCSSDDRRYQSNAPYPSGPPPVVMPERIGPPRHIQGPPPGMTQSSGQYPPPVQQYPPSQNMLPHGPPPNFRMPPPGTNPPPNFMPGMYNVPQRPMFDPSRPPIQGPPPSYQGYSGRPRGRDYTSRSLRGRTPPGIIDDPLEAFNRMLREKDERERRNKQRKVRSYSRSSSRSYSRSPRRRSRTPRRRSRSRSKSFTMSRSRSRSYTPTNRASPYRDYSPRRRPPSRYRASPQRSPSRYRYKDAPERIRERDYDRERERDRDRDRDRERERERERDYVPPKRENVRAFSRDRASEFHYYDNYERDKVVPQQPPPQQRGAPKWAPPSRDTYYPQDHQPMGYHQPAGPIQQHPVPNSDPSASSPQKRRSGADEEMRTGKATVSSYPREPYPPYKSDHSIPPLLQQQILLPSRRYDDVAPPGTEQPLPPGEEPRYEDRYINPYENRLRLEPQPMVDHYPMDNHDKYPESEKYMREERYPENREAETLDRRGYNEKPREDRERDKDKRHDQYNRSPRRSKDRNESPDKHKRKKREETPEKVKREEKDKEKEREREKEKEKEKKRDHSDDERGKKTKEKKKKRDKRESEKKKKKDKKEKREHKKEEKEKAKHDREKKEDVEKPVVAELPVLENVKDVMKEVSPSRIESPNVEPDRPPSAVQEQTFKIQDEEIPKQPEPKESPRKLQEPDLYGDILSEGIDDSIVQSYGKIDESRKKSVSPVERNKSPEPQGTSEHSDDEHSEPQETPKEYEDVLELYTGELKSELDKEMLAPLPEKSKWELDEEPNPVITDDQQEVKTEKSNKVTNEVLKRAENAIFAKAINAIRPIEIKKISLDRVKLYSGEKDDKKEEEPKMEQVLYHFEEAANAAVEPAKIDSSEQPKPARLSVKERLGCKVDELDRIVRVDRTYDRNRSRTLSPLAKRSQDIRNERRVEVDDKRRERDRQSERDRLHRNYRNERRDRNHSRRRDERRDRTRNRTRDREPREKDKKERSRSSKTKDDDKRERSKRTRSRSDDRKDKHKKREKKQKKERPKKHHKKEDEPKVTATVVAEAKSEPTVKVPKPITEKRKTTLDEANFVPDYDIETDPEEDKTREPKKRLDVNPPPEQEVVPTKKPHAKPVEVKQLAESSSSDSSSSSSEDEKKKKRHKKHRKRKRKESSSSSSDSESSSSEEEKDRKKKKHKKRQKKKKKSKHK